jgi:glycosyltransferase involved in cell wall biosynthesis
MACYQGENFLAIQLESLLAQDYPHLEIICVDDASSDATWSILQSYAAKDTRMHIFQNDQNLGYRKTFEKGINLAKGELIALSDQDDYWIPSKISRLVESIGSASLIYADSDLVDETGQFIGQKMSDIKRQIAYGNPLMYTFGAWAPGHSMLFKRDLLKFAFPVVDFVTHDYLIGFAATCANGIAYLPESLVHYRQHDNNTIGANLKKAPKTYTSRKEKKDRILARLNLLQARCPTGPEQQVLNDFYLACNGSGLIHRINRVRIVLKHHDDMLAYKGKSAFGKFAYCFKLFFALY